MNHIKFIFKFREYAFRAFFPIAALLLSVQGLADSNPDSTEIKGEIKKESEEKEPWKPAFVGGVQGRLLGFGYNGFLQLDGANFSDDSSGEFEDAFDIRRARLTFTRELPKQWDIKGSAELNQGNIELKDFYGRYNGLSFATLQIGNQKEPFSLQYNSSSRFNTLMERGLVINALTPGRNIGITMHSQKENMTAALGLFTRGFTQDDLQTSGDAVTGRTTFYRFNGPQKILHGGLSASYRRVGSSPPRFRSRPETGIDDIYMIDTGDLNQAENVGRIGLEGAYVNGRLTLQGEYVAARVWREGDLDTLNFDGGYLFVSWFFTGESRTYFKTTGTFGRVFPSAPFMFGEGGSGAWELALRLSQANLSDKDINGGRETNITIGLNWYLREYVVIRANYVKVTDLDRPGTAYDNNTMNIFQLRLQLEF